MGRIPKKKKDDKKKDDKKDVDSEIERVETNIHRNPKEIRMQLWDGNVIAGELSVDSIQIQTEFGMLNVPVEKIKAIRPGLNSFPELKKKIDLHIENLGHKDYKTRQQAHKSIVAMGMQLRNELPNFEDGGNAERKRHLDEIRKEVNQMVEEMMDDEDLDGADAPLIRNDQIETKDFTIVGMIQQKRFDISSRYGKLAIQLGDIKVGDRPSTGSTETRRTVSITGKNFMSSNAKSTGIRVDRGDKIIIRAEGQIVMSPWGSNSSVGPDGNTSYGNYSGHGGGTLLGKIGSNGKMIKIGSKSSFIASRSGTLQLGVAVQTDYANNNYAFPGNYKVKITVVSGE